MKMESSRRKSNKHKDLNRIPIINLSDHEKMVINGLTFEANGELGRRIILYLIDKNPRNRWMLKYHCISSAHAIPQVVLLINEIFERGILKGFYKEYETLEQLSKFLEKRLPFTTVTRFSSGFFHTVNMLADKNMLVRVLVPNKHGYNDHGRIVDAILSKEDAISLCHGPPFDIWGSYSRDQWAILEEIGMSMVDPGFDWYSFEKYGKVIADLREMEQILRKARFEKQKKLKKKDK